MHNLTVPSVLKAWIDQILRAGRTFRSAPAGKIGMIRDRPVVVGIASGGVFAGDRANQPDFLRPYLSVVLGSIGLKSVQFLAIQATAFLNAREGAIAREEALAAMDLQLGRGSTAVRPQRSSRSLPILPSNSKGSASK